MSESTHYTIYDVAKKAKTSAATVSRVLNNTGYPVSEKLRKRVLKTAEEMSYSPNIIAKNLKYRDSRDIGVVIPTISNPFYSSVMMGVEEIANMHNYNVLLCNTLRDRQRERTYLQSLCDKQVKGIILSSMGNFLQDYIQRGMHFVLLDQKIEGMQCPIVDVDVARGAFLAVEHLIENGHEKIAFVSSPLTRWTRRELFAGYQKALAHHNIPFRTEYVFITEGEHELEEFGYEFNNGRQLAKKITDSGLDVTAVVAVNDMTAFGCIQYFMEAGINVPGKVSIIGFDDIAFSKMFTPSLTTVRFPAYELGKLAGAMLFDHLQGVTDRAYNMKIEPELIVRNSVKRLTT